MRQAAGFRGLLCDLDGVVYRGREACPGAVQGLAAARKAGVRVLFMTNNAGHTPEGIAEHLTELGVGATAQEVLTSSQVAAGYLVDREKPGSGGGPRSDGVDAACRTFGSHRSRPPGSHARPGVGRRPGVWPAGRCP
jgi:ribonucleotide monophosphatase NagD (HAD superfamily)